jgi:hypothetical protein
LATVRVLPGPNKQREAKRSFLKAELGEKTISPAALFVLGIHFTNLNFYDSRCPFSQIDNQKQMLGRTASHFQKKCSVVD